MKITAIVVQALILVAAWYLIANRIEANTYFGSVSYNVDVIAENIRWIMLGAACLSIFNIWVWWPKARKVVNTSSEKAQEVTNAETDKAKDQDPVVPKMD